MIHEDGLQAQEEQGVEQDQSENQKEENLNVKTIGETEKNSLSDLLSVIQTSGLKATGLILHKTQSDRIVTLKGNMPADEFLELHWVQQHLKENISTMVGHCRMPTKGDPSKNENNHPFSVGNTVIVHQGVLWNDEDLVKKYDFKSPGETDSWVIAEMIEMYRNKGMTMVNAIAQAHSELKGSWAVVAMDRLDPDSLYLFCHFKEFKVIYLPEKDQFIFSTEAKELDKSLLVGESHFGFFNEVSIPRMAELKLGDEDCLVLGKTVELWTLSAPETYNYGRKWDWDNNNEGKKKGRHSKNKKQLLLPEKAAIVV